MNNKNVILIVVDAVRSYKSGRDERDRLDVYNNLTKKNFISFDKSQILIGVNKTSLNNPNYLLFFAELIIHSTKPVFSIFKFNPTIVVLIIVYDLSIDVFKKNSPSSLDFP